MGKAFGAAGDRAVTRPVMLESIFSIRDDAFRAYMSLPDLTNVPVFSLHRLSEQMEQSKEPVVTYAAGWAAFEEATLIDGTVPYFRRAVALERAKTIWARAEEGLHELYLEHKDSDKQITARDYALGLTLRAQFAQSSIPAAEMAILRLSGKDEYRDFMAASMRIARMSFLSFGNRLRPRHPSKTKVNGERLRATKAGVRNEVLSLLLLQEVDTTDEIVLPSSVREDHNIDPAHRNDLQVLTFGTESASSTRVQVTSNGTKILKDDMLTIHTSEFKTYGEGILTPPDAISSS